MAKSKLPPRVKLQRDAAAKLEITARALRDWSKESWWKPDFRTADGYDIDAIKSARDTEGKKGSEVSNERDRIRLQKETTDLEIRELEKRRKIRDEESAAGNVLALDEYEDFVVEVLSIFRDEVLEVSERAVEFVPKKHQATLRVELDRLLRDALENAESALNDGPEPE